MTQLSGLLAQAFNDALQILVNIRRGDRDSGLTIGIYEWSQRSNFGDKHIRVYSFFFLN